MLLQNFLTNSRDEQSRGRHWAPAPERGEIWPAEYLRDFAIRMAMNGMTVSGVRLRNDPIYTLQLLATAHAADDDVLRAMAMSLFQQFESKQSDISCPADE